MRSYIDIKGRKYLYEAGYKDNEVLRRSFNELAEKSFGINFEKWYKEGYWGEEYTPHSLVYEDKVIANVSVSIMNILINGVEKKYIQIGTVMTDEYFRNNGLSRFLIERVIEEWDNKCDGMYLYANDGVLDFYPKFGFEKCNEYEYSINNTKRKSIEKVRKLNLEEEEDKNLFIEVLNNRIPLYKLSVKNNSWLIMFYCIDFMKNNIYYIENYNAIAICEYEDEVLYVQDVFSKEEVNINDLVNILMREETKKVVLEFTPNNTEGYECNLVNKEDTKFFVRGLEENIFEREKLMLPILSHA